MKISIILRVFSDRLFLGSHGGRGCTGGLLGREGCGGKSGVGGQQRGGGVGAIVGGGSTVGVSSTSKNRPSHHVSVSKTV